MNRTAPYHAQMATFRRTLLRHALDAAGGNRVHAARALGLQRGYLLRLLASTGVAAEAGPSPHDRRRVVVR